MFCTNRSVFKTFWVSLELLWLFIVFPVWTSLKLTMSLSKNFYFFFNISTSISKKKVWIFLLSLSISYSLPWISWFVSFYWGLCYMGFRTWVGLFLLSVTEWVLLIILLRCYILVLSWLNFSIEYVYWSVLIWACHTHCDLS